MLKARQLGITEQAASFALWQVNFHRHNKVIVFSQDETKAREFARKCRVAWAQHPVPARFTIRTGEDNDEDAPGTDDAGWAVRRFTIRLDRLGSELAEEDPDA